MLSTGLSRAYLVRSSISWPRKAQNYIQSTSELSHSAIVLVALSDCSSRSTKDTLQLVGPLLQRTDQETAAVVSPAIDERTEESSD